MRYLLVALLFTIGCGIKIKPEPVKIETSPIEVNHRIMLDTDALYEYYQIACESEVVDPSNQAQINQCADQKLNDFVTNFTTLI